MANFQCAYGHRTEGRLVLFLVTWLLFRRVYSGGQPCRLRPKVRAWDSWADLLADHSGEFRQVLVFSVPRGVLDGAAFQMSASDGARLTQALRTANGLKAFAAIAHSCVLLLPAEEASRLRPLLLPPSWEISRYPAILLWTSGDGVDWQAHQRSRMDVRRMNGCGLQVECFLLDLALIARSAGHQNSPEWTTLTTPWPGKRKVRGGVGTPDVVSTVSYAHAGAPVVPPCLLNFIDEVIRLRPVDDSLLTSSVGKSSLALLIVHFTALRMRRSQMAARLSAAGLQTQSLFLEMEPDDVNDTMRHCMGPERQLTMDSMSDNPDWRPPTRGEDSLALKHLASAIWLLRSDRPHVLVLEDDAWFSQHLAVDIASLLAEAESFDWGVIAVGTCYHHRTPFGLRASAHLWLTGIMPCAHAYLLSRTGAAAILASLPLQLPIDLQISTIAQRSANYEDLRKGRWLFENGAATIYWAEPQLAFQWPEDTTRSVERT